MSLIVTTIAPATEPGVPGEVIDCFQLPFGVTEIVFCGDEMAFVRDDGSYIHATDMGDVGACPRCQAVTGEDHRCANPAYQARP